MAQSEATNIKSISKAEMGLGGSLVDVLPRHQSSRERRRESQNSNRHRGELTGPNSALPLITGTQRGRKHPQDTLCTNGHGPEPERWPQLWAGVTVDGDEAVLSFILKYRCLKDFKTLYKEREIGFLRLKETTFTQVHATVLLTSKGLSSVCVLIWTLKVEL